MEMHVILWILVNCKNLFPARFWRITDHVTLLILVNETRPPDPQRSDVHREIAFDPRGAQADRQLSAPLQTHGCRDDGLRAVLAGFLAGLPQAHTIRH